MDKLFFKSYAFFSLGMGSYGFYRGYQSTHENSHKFYFDKLTEGFINGTMYIIPPIQFFALRRLLNRVEIQYHNFDPQQHKEEYREFGGFHFKTI